MRSDPLWNHGAIILGGGPSLESDFEKTWPEFEKRIFQDRLISVNYHYHRTDCGTDYIASIEPLQRGYGPHTVSTRGNPDTLVKVNFYDTGIIDSGSFAVWWALNNIAGDMVLCGFDIRPHLFKKWEIFISTLRDDRLRLRPVSGPIGGMI